MSVLDQLKALDEQRGKLIADAKAEALTKAEEAVAALNELGFSYRLVEGSSASPVRAASSGGRRTGIRDDVLRVVEEHDGVSRADILEQMDAKGDKKAEQSISNALANLKKAGKINLAEGMYRAA